jgi:hypothetical protein
MRPTQFVTEISVPVVSVSILVIRVVPVDLVLPDIEDEAFIAMSGTLSCL